MTDRGIPFPRNTRSPVGQCFLGLVAADHVRPPQIVDEVTSARHLLALLENQRLLAENSLYFLQTLLYYIARPDLYQIVLQFRAGRQDDYKEKGVDISDQYKGTNH